MIIKSFLKGDAAQKSLFNFLNQLQEAKEGSPRGEKLQNWILSSQRYN